MLVLIISIILFIVAIGVTVYFLYSQSQANAKKQRSRILNNDIVQLKTSCSSTENNPSFLAAEFASTNPALNIRENVCVVDGTNLNCTEWKIHIPDTDENDKTPIDHNVEFQLQSMALDSQDKQTPNLKYLTSDCKQLDYSKKVVMQKNSFLNCDRNSLCTLWTFKKVDATDPAIYTGSLLGINVKSNDNDCSKKFIWAQEDKNPKVVALSDKGWLEWAAGECTTWLIKKVEK